MVRLDLLGCLSQEISCLNFCADFLFLCHLRLTTSARCLSRGVECTYPIQAGTDSPSREDDPLPAHNAFSFGPETSPTEETFFELDFAIGGEQQSRLEGGLDLSPTVDHALCSFPPLPDSNILNQVFDLYFTEADISIHMLSRWTFQMTESPSTLLVTSILLVTPYLARDQVPGLATAPEWQARDRALFLRVKAELLPLASTGPNQRGQIHVESVAAVVNLIVWALFKGLGKLARHLAALAQYLATLADLFDDVQSLRPPTSPRTWEELVESTFGPRIWASNVPAQTLYQLRLSWIDFFTKQRTAQMVLFLKWSLQDWNRNLETTVAFDLACLERQVVPMPKWWKESFNENFDPRVAPRLPLLSDVFAFLRFQDPSDPQRLQSLSSLGQSLIEHRMALRWLDIVMRNQVDLFLVSCKKAGLSSPAELPIDQGIVPGGSTFVNEIGLETMQHLLTQRQKVDDILLQIRSSYTEATKQALADSSAEKIIGQLVPYTGCYHTAFNSVTYFCSLILLRLELYSSLGVYLTGSKEDITQLNSESEVLAHEYGRGGDLFLNFLEEAILYTQLLNNWTKLNPNFEHHIVSNITLIFRICCLHSAFARRFRRSLASGDGSLGDQHPVDVLSQVTHDMTICLDTLARYSKRGVLGTSIYNLAQKIASDQKVDAAEVEEARWRKDIQTSEQVNDLSMILGVYQHLRASS